MMNNQRDQKNPPPAAPDKRESGVPGGGQGRIDEVGRSGVYPASGPFPGTNAEVRPMASWGQGERGAAGYKDHGDSELNFSAGAGREPFQCRELMTDNPVCCLPGDTVERAAQLMKREDIGPVPVVENEQTKKLVGIVTDRDLAIKVVAEGRDPRQVTVEEVMTRDLVTCKPEDNLQQALDVMASYQVRRIPVVTNDGRIVGIISQADIATRLGAPRETAEVVEEISQPG
jgi:CBS domain-containing protein